MERKCINCKYINRYTASKRFYCCYWTEKMNKFYFVRMNSSCNHFKDEWED